MSEHGQDTGERPGHVGISASTATANHRDTETQRTATAGHREQQQENTENSNGRPQRMATAVQGNTNGSVRLPEGTGHTIKSDPDTNWKSWVLCAVGGDDEQTFSAPVTIPGWNEAPWVRLRPLTARESLKRDSLGIRDEYEIGADDQITGIRRTCDFEKMLDFDLDKCVTDYLLPLTTTAGDARAVRCGDPDAPKNSELLDHLSPRMLEWLVECVETVNMRRPQDQLLVSEAKKD